MTAHPHTGHIRGFWNVYTNGTSPTRWKTRADADLAARQELRLMGRRRIAVLEQSRGHITRHECEGESDG